MRTRKSISLFWLMVVAAVFSVGCESSGEQGGERDGSSGGSSPAGPGETVKVNGTEAIVWGEGERGAVAGTRGGLRRGEWGGAGARCISESGAVALAVEGTFAQSVAEASRYLEEERGVRTVTLVGTSAGTGGVLSAAEVKRSG